MVKISFIIIGILLFIGAAVLSAIAFFEGWISNTSSYSGYSIAVISGVVVLMIAGGVGFIYRGFTTGNDPDGSLAEHRTKLLKEYYDNNTKPETFWGLSASPVKTQMLAHFKTGYPELKIPEKYDECVKLDAASRKSFDKVAKEVQAGLDAIREKYGPPRNIDYIPPRKFDDVAVLNRMIGKIGTSEWNDYTLTDSNWPDFFDLTFSPNNIDGVLSLDNSPEKFVKDLNAFAKEEESKIVADRVLKGKAAEARGRFDIAIATALGKVRLSYLKGKCDICPSS